MKVQLERTKCPQAGGGRLFVGLLAAAAMIFASPLALQALLPSSAHPDVARLIAWRGYSVVAPENTLAALRRAGAAGFDAAWVDVRLTSDGLPILLADPTLDRTTTCTGAVADLPSEVVLRCDAGSHLDPAFSGETVPPLSEALALSTLHLWLHVSVGTGTAIDAVAAAIEQADAATRVTLIVAEVQQVPALRAAVPEAPIYIALRSVVDWRHATTSGADGIALTLATGRLDTTADAAAIQGAAAAGLEVAAYAIADERGLRDALAHDINHLAVARVESAKWSMDFVPRSYSRSDIGRPLEPQVGFTENMVVGDFDGDGIDDLVIASTNDRDGGSAAGSLTILYGGDSFPARQLHNVGTDVELQWGSVMAVGNFNGSEFDDLVIGTPRSNRGGANAGGLWLWEGSAGGLRGLPRPFGPPPQPGDQLGAALAVGDFNGDGIDDLAASAPGASIDRRLGAGRVFVLPGRLDAGPVLAGSLRLDRSLAAVPGEPLAGEAFGTTLGFSDLNGDSLADLLVGLPEATVGIERAAGAVLVATSAGETVTNTLIISDAIQFSRDDDFVPGFAERNARFGARIVTADFDGDGFGDVAIAAPGSTVAGVREAGDVLVLYSGPEGLDHERTLSLHQDLPGIPDSPDTRAGFGLVLAAGDLNGDRIADLVIGMPQMTRERTLSAGAVTVVRGGVDGLNPDFSFGLAPDMWPWRGSLETGLRFGAALAIGDFNGDLAADLAIGVPGRDVGAIRDAGELVIAWGYSDALDGFLPPPTATQPGGPTATATPSAPVGDTPTASATGPTATPSMTPISPSATPTPTPRPPAPAYLPLAARLLFSDRFGPGIR